MEYRRFGSKYVVRMDTGEEIAGKVMELAEKEHIRLASISALGALSRLRVGVFKMDEQKFYANEFRGDYEIVSLTGTINTMDGKPYVHLHLAAADDTGRVVGGHLQSAVISATCEMVVDLIDGAVDRRFDPQTGLNQFLFN